MALATNETKRLADRVEYLGSADLHSVGMHVDKTRISVILWTDAELAAGNSPITLVLDASPFSVHQRLTGEQARAIARGLMAAADELEASEVANVSA